MKTIHIFIVNNTISNLISTKLAKQLNGEILVVLMSSELINNYNFKSNVIQFNSKWGNSLFHKIKIIQESKKAFSEIIDKIDKYEDIYIYLPNLNSPLTNRLFFNSKLCYNNINYNTIVEGSLNYTDYYIDSKYIFKSFIKTILGWIYLFPYKNFTGYFDGSDQEKIKKIYAPTSIGLKRNKDIEVVSISHDTINNNDNNDILIIGQYLSSQLSKEKTIELEVSFLNFLKSYINTSHNIYYKPHPLSIGDDFILKQLEIMDVTIIYDKRPVELWTKGRNIKTIISISSSALMTSKLIYLNKIECISYGMNFLKLYSNINYTKLIKLYKKLGVTLIDKL